MNMLFAIAYKIFETHTATPKMSHPHQATKMPDDNYYYPVVDLEAPQARLPQGISPDTALFELSGESSLPTQSILHGASPPGGQETLPQANPWPFHQDDSSGTTGSFEVRRATTVTCDTNHRLANPWPYHGVESDNADIGNAAENKKEHENSTETTVPRAEVDEVLVGEPGPELHNDQPVAELDGVATDQSYNRAARTYDEQQRSNITIPDLQFKYNETTASTQFPASTNTHTNPTSASSGPANKRCEPQIPGILRCSDTPQKPNTLTFCTQSALSNVQEDGAILSGKPLDFTEETSESQREHVVPTCPSPNRQMQDQVISNETLYSQPGWQLLNGVASQPPPPYSSQETTVSIFENTNTGSHVQSQSSFAPTTKKTWSSFILPEPSAAAHSQAEAFSSEPRFPLEAPPLPPRRPTQTKFMAGLSNGPHNNVAFPPPPKRHNVTPTRFPPPTPQRPTMLSSSLSSSKLLGSSSAKKWLEKTNQAIEDTLDAVLQGPAGHPSRPAYINRPAQNSSQQTPQSSTGCYNSTQLNSSERRNKNI